jgi:CheY-like chemotaxis protein
MVIDGSKVVRKLIEQLLVKDVPGVTVISCESGAEAKAALQEGVVDLVTMALRLPDIDGLELAHYIREHATQAYIPIIVVSGDVQERLLNRSFGDDVTDYFDKSLGFNALSAFIRGYVRPESEPGGDVLYVEDSKVVAMATRRMLEKNGLRVTHVISVEDALAHLETAKAQGRIPGPDVVLTDVYLKSGLTGKDLLERVRGPEYGYSKAQLPILVMTGDDNPANQSALLRCGANDLVQKPIEERLLVTKLVFQLRVGRMMREKVATA